MENILYALEETIFLVKKDTKYLKKDFSQLIKELECLIGTKIIYEKIICSEQINKTSQDKENKYH